MCEFTHCNIFFPPIIFQHYSYRISNCMFVALLWQKLIQSSSSGRGFHRKCGMIKLSIFVYLYICIFVYLYICIFVYLYICIFVFSNSTSLMVKEINWTVKRIRIVKVFCDSTLFRFRIAENCFFSHPGVDSES